MNWYLKVLKQYADFKGRSRRKEYWMFALISTIISYTIIGLAAVVDPILVSISTVYSLAVLLPSIGVGVRRMHDVGKSGWYLLIPFYNLYLLCIDGEPNINEYGANPKNPIDELNDIGVTE